MCGQRRGERREHVHVHVHGVDEVDGGRRASSMGRQMLSTGRRTSSDPRRRAARTRMWIQQRHRNMRRGRSSLRWACCAGARRTRLEPPGMTHQCQAGAGRAGQASRAGRAGPELRLAVLGCCIGAEPRPSALEGTGMG
jgi:hypothetical protein